MRNRITLALSLTVALWATHASAYEVWIGTHLMRSADVDNLSDWSLTAAQVEGLNVNRSPHDTDPASNSQWRTVFAQYANVRGALQGYARSEATRDPSKVDELAFPAIRGRLEEIFSLERNFGYDLTTIMFYDERGTYQGTEYLYEWTEIEIQYMRDWLDGNGHADVELKWNVRNNGLRNRQLAEHPLVDSVEIETSTTAFLENRNGQRTFFDWFWTNPVTANKSIALQLPRALDGGNQYRETRRVVQSVGRTIGYGEDGMRSDRLIILPVTYNDNYDYLPETVSSGTAYTNTLTSLVLSLIEQRPLFEGRLPNLPTVADADSYARYEITDPGDGPTSGLVAHWPLDESSGTTATDASGFGSDGALIAGAQFASDAVRGNHVVFDGVDDRIDTPFAYALSASDDFTWAWWAKKTTPSGTDDGAIMLGNRYPQGAPGETFEFIKFTPVGAQFANTDSASQIGRYGYTVPTGDWKHYAMVKSGTSYQLYVNGAPMSSTQPPFTYDETSPIPFFIGGDGGGGGGEHFQGGIDDVVLYRSALTPSDINNVINGNYFPVITLTTLGSPVDSTNGSVWSDGEPAHGGAEYVIPATGNLRSENGASVFPGNVLTVQAGGKFQVRAIESEVTTVNQLILEGGSSFSPGPCVELAAGTGTGVTNVIDGRITQSGATRLLTYGGSIARKLKILSEIEGDGTLQLVGEGTIVDNDSNSFSGLWQVADGSELVFETAGAVGMADIEVQSGGTLEIKGNWTQDATLAVADVSGTEVKVGINEWKVSSLVLGGTPVEDGVYSPSELSGLGSALFAGTGRITVGTPLFSQEVVAGWDLWSSNTAPVANVTGSGIIATAMATTASGSWNITDNASSGRGSSGDTSWGSFDGNGNPASAVTSGEGSNMTAANGETTAELTLTITNNGEADWDLDGFHMDVVAFRPNAPRTYQLEIVSGDITHGVVFTSTNDEINELGGTLSGNNDDHDEVDVSLIGLADSTLESGELAVIRIAFSSGTGDGGGHHLFLDNVAVSGVLSPVSELQTWRYEYFGTTENSGTAADDFDANFDGESNLLEFATGQDPYANTLVPTPMEMNGDSLEFRYTRSKAALDDGYVFTVEWSDTLLPGSWSSAGVSDITDPENPGSSELNRRLATIPAGNAGRRFIHLEVSEP